MYEPIHPFSDSLKRLLVSDVSTFLAMFNDFLVIVVILVMVTGHLREMRRLNMGPSIAGVLFTDSEPKTLSSTLITLSDVQCQACQI